MNPEDRERFKEVLHELSEAGAAERAAILERVLGEHPKLGAALRELLPYLDTDDQVFLGSDLDDPIPETIGRFRVERLLGRGSMGEVYLAIEPPPMERRIAVKVIRAGLASRNIRRRFEFERETLKTLDHENIAKIIDGGTDGNGLLYVAMEFVDGPPITEYASRLAAVADRVRLVRQVCAGVEHAHLAGLVHRDLKPANVLVGERNGEPVAKVIDFGIAKLVGRPDAGMDTMPGSPLGTVEYMSPEQAQGLLARVDQRSDVYSIGVILYELLTGQLPRSREQILEWSGPDFLKQLNAHQVVPPSRIMLGRPRQDRSLPPRRLRELDWIVLHTVDVDPERRYRSIRELIDDLDRFLRGDAVLAAPPSVLYSLSKFTRRHFVATSAAVLLLVSLSAFAVAMSVSQSRVRAALNETRSSLEAKEAALADADAASQFLTQLLSEASPYASARDRTVGQLVDEAAEHVAEKLAAAPSARWRVTTMLADVFQLQGRTDRALILAKSAVDDTERTWGPRSDQHAESLRIYGKVLTGADRLADARDAVASAVEIFERNRKERRPSQLVAACRLLAMDALAMLEARLGRPERAIELFTESVGRWQQEMPNTEGPLFAQVMLAHLYCEKRAFDDAERILDEARAGIAARKKVTPGGEKNVLLASAEVAERRGDLDTAIAYSKQIAVRSAEWFGPDSYHALSARVSLADLQSERNPDWPTLLEEYRDVLTKAEAGHLDMEIVGASLGIGKALLRLGRIEEALVPLERAMSLTVRMRGPDSDELAPIALVYAEAFQAAGRQSEATDMVNLAARVGGDETAKEVERLRAMLK